MSNYNSTHTGAEIDAAIGRVLDGGSIKVQTDTNTTNISSLEADMNTVLSQMSDVSEITEELGRNETYPQSAFLDDGTYWYIGQNADVGSTYSGAIQKFSASGVFFRLPTIIQLKVGDTITIAVDGAANARGWAICSMSNVILDVCPVNGEYINNPYTYTATERCVVYVNSHFVAGSVIVTKQTSKLDNYLADYADFKAETKDDIADLESKLGVKQTFPSSAFSDSEHYWNIGANAVVGGTYTGALGSFPGFLRIPNIIQLNAGDRVILSVNGGNAARGWAICSLDGTILDVCPVNTSYLITPYEYTANQPCLLYANTKGSVGDVVIYYAQDAIEKIIEEVSASTPKIFNPKIDLVTRPQLRILDIGNSFSADATDYLQAFVTSAGLDLSNFTLYRLMRSGGSFKTFYDSWHNQDSYAGETGCIYTIGNVIGFNRTIEGLTKLERMHYTIENLQWDVIVIHNYSRASLSYKDWEGDGDNGYLKEFIRILRLYQPKATIGFMMPHASHRDSPDTVVGWQSIGETIRWMQTHYGVDFIVPVGTAIENLRASSLKTASVTHEFSRDDHHLGFGLARYVANATYFQATISTRFGVSVYGNSAVHAVTEGEMVSPSYTYPDDCVDVTNANKGLAQICAICACDDMFTITPPDGIGDTL